MLNDYAACESRALVHEGGFTNNPRDPGGPTNYGITIADARRYGKELGWVANPSVHDMRAMPMAFAEKVIKFKYWDILDCDALPAGVDDTVFDYGLNSGIGRSGKTLRRVLGMTDDTWRITPDVLDALAKRDPFQMVNAINNERIHFLRGLNTWREFGAGWTTRVKEVRSFSLELAGAAKRNAPVPTMPFRAFTPPTAAAPRGKGILPPPGHDGAIGSGILVATADAISVHGGVSPIAAVAAGVVAAGAIGFCVYSARRRYQANFSAKQEAPSGGETLVPRLDSYKPRYGLAA